MSKVLFAPTGCASGATASISPAARLGSNFLEIMISLPILKCVCSSARRVISKNLRQADLKLQMHLIALRIPLPACLYAFLLCLRQPTPNCADSSTSGGRRVRLHFMAELPGFVMLSEAKHLAHEYDQRLLPYSARIPSKLRTGSSPALRMTAWRHVPPRKSVAHRPAPDRAWRLPKVNRQSE
jgi:hypothetical protein